MKINRESVTPTHLRKNIFKETTQQAAGALAMTKINLNDVRKTAASNSRIWSRILMIGLLLIPQSLLLPAWSQYSPPEEHHFYQWDFDENKLEIVITPDFFPIIWRHADKYGIDYENTTDVTDCVIGEYDEATHTVNVYHYCSDAAMAAGATSFKTFSVPGYGTVTIYYDENLEAIASGADLDSDTIGDSQDDDIDGDGVPNSSDQYPRDPTRWDDEVQDIDGDGIANAYDAYPFDASKYTDIVASPRGGLDVSQSGGALYTIPVAVPPGIGDVAPNLAIQYNSQSGDGLMGLGWRLGGLSTVSRCSADLANDTKVDGVDFDSNDKLCLNGQLLVETGAGSDSNGSYTQYQTEIDSFQRIRGYGNLSGFPTFFIVWNRSGKIMEYGRTTDSAIEAQGRQDILVWALNKSSDSAGNYYTVTYTEDNAKGEFIPYRIDYTGNSTVPSAPFNSIRFEYDGRQDTRRSYVAGSMITASKLLSNIKIYSGSNLVKRYAMSYKNHGYTAQSVVDKIFECDSQNKCIAAVSVDWSNNAGTMFSAYSCGIDTSNPYFPSCKGNQTKEVGEFTQLGRYKFDYFDNNSKLDLLYLGSQEGSPYVNGHDNWYVYGINDGAFSNPPAPVSSSYNEQQKAAYQMARVKTADFNGDGIADVYFVNGGNSAEADTIRIRDGGTIPGPVTWVSSDYNAAEIDVSRINFGDFNGDGRADIYRINGWGTTSATDTVYLSNGDGTYQTVNNTGISTAVSSSSWDAAKVDISRVTFGDFNGDGLTDVYYMGWQAPNSAKYDHVYFSNGDGTFSSANAPGLYHSGSQTETLDAMKTTIARRKFGDFNGDGKTDVYMVLGSNSTTEDIVYLSTGLGNFVSVQSGVFTYVTNSSHQDARNDIAKIQVADMNGDGMSDIYYFKGENAGASDLIYFASGDGTFTSAYTGPNHATATQLGNIKLGDFDGDGIADVNKLFTGESNRGTGFSVYSVVHQNLTKKILATKFVDSLGGTVDVSYDPMSQSLNSGLDPNYGQFLDYPYMELRGSLHVVEKVSVNDGIGGQSAKRYLYDGYRADNERKESLGFSSMDVQEDRSPTNPIFDFSTRSSYYQKFPFTGLPALTETRIHKFGTGFQVLSKVTNSYNGQPGFTCSSSDAPLLCQSVETFYDLDDGLLIKTVTTATSYDAYGNAVQVNVTTTAGNDTFSTSSTHTYGDDDITQWHLGRLTRSVVTKTAPGISGTLTSTRTSEFKYDDNTGMLIRETVEPDSTDPNIRLTTAYQRDSFGNIVKTTLCDGAVLPDNCNETSQNARTTTISYLSNDPSYPTGLFPTSITNALGHTQTQVFDPRFGTVKSTTGPNTLTTTSFYDNWGRKTLETRADDTETSVTYTYCWSNCPTVGSTTAKYKVVTQTTGTAPATVYMDAHDREIRRQGIGFLGQLIYVDTEYDAHGRVSRVSEPYFSTDSPIWTVYGYDDINRQISVDMPHTTQNVLTDYAGLKTTVTDVMGHITEELLNGISQREYVIQAKGTADEIKTLYRYDAAGNLQETEIEGHPESLIHIDYDARGRKESLDDPDMGHWEYVYNAFGELVQQTDAKDQTTKLEYNSLGQLKKRTDLYGTASPLVNEWIYGHSATNHNVGKLVATHGAYGTAKTFEYDTFGRPSKTITSLSTVYNTTAETYITEQSYSQGRPDVTTYPATLEYPSGFKAKRIYNANGYLEKVQTTNGSKVYWQADTMNARGQIVTDTLGNGASTVRTYNPGTGWIEGIMTLDSQLNLIQHMVYEFYDNGSLENRIDNRQSGLTEHFEYDALGRLDSSQVGSQPIKDYVYDPLGNITSKPGVGSYTYGTCNAGPHAVCQAGTNAFQYDANGNVELSGTRVVSYTPFNKPHHFEEGQTHVNFVYGADQSRLVKSVSSPAEQSRIAYIGLGGSGGSLFEAQIDDLTGTREHRHYIYANGSNAVAMHVVEDNGTAVTDTKDFYFHHDHLGSVEAVSDDTGLAANAVLMSYDAWGLRRNADWTDATSTQAYLDGVRGYTGHETIDEMSLVHMNGRVYDPKLGKFLSADPFVQSAELSQGLNRYAYVGNNPLSNIDPTGYFSVKRFFNRIGDAIKSFSDSIQEEWGEFWDRDLKPFLNRLTRHCDGCGAGYTNDPDSPGFYVGDTPPAFSRNQGDQSAIQIGSAPESSVPQPSEYRVDAGFAVMIDLTGTVASFFVNGSSTATQQETAGGKQKISVDWKQVQTTEDRQLLGDWLEEFSNDMTIDQSSVQSASLGLIANAFSSVGIDWSPAEINIAVMNDAVGQSLDQAGYMAGIGLSAVPVGGGANGLRAMWASQVRYDIIRGGPTVVSNQLVRGSGSTGATVARGIKGGGRGMPFHYHIHRYNWYKPWLWFKNTPIIKP